MDLGHFNLSCFESMARNQAYFLSRYLARVGVLTPDRQSIDLLKWLQSACNPVLDQPIRLGKQKKHQLSCRLVAFRLPQQVAEQRRRKAKANAKRRGQTVSRATLALLDYAIYVTNVPENMLSARQVACLYRVRWQIELVFKLWKSYAGLREFAQMRRERVLTELYARMIGLVLTHFLVAPLRMPEGALTNREISPVHARTIFQRFARSLNRLLHNLDQFVAELATMLSHISRFGFKQKRKKMPNVCHALALISAIYRLDDDPQPEFNLTPLLA
jgi:methyl-accepting chemotaxis protein